VAAEKYQRTVGYPSTSWASCIEFRLLGRLLVHAGARGGEREGVGRGEREGGRPEVARQPLAY